MNEGVDQAQEPASGAAHFGAEVKALRESLGLSQAEFADKLHYKQAQVSKVENGTVLASEAFAVAMDRAAGTPGVYTRMRQRAADAGNPAWLIPYLQLEREAASICDYSPALVPGILQTPEYAEAVYRAARPDEAPLRIKQQVEDRMRRREVFDTPSPPLLWVILHEAVLWSAMGGTGVMRRQLQHLMAVAEHPRITVQVFPLEGTPARKTPFVLLKRQDMTEFLYAESHVQGQVHDRPEAVAEAVATYERLRADALSLPDSLSLTRHVMEAYNDEHHPRRPHPRNLGEVQLQRRQRRNLRRMGPRVRNLRHRPRP